MEEMDRRGLFAAFSALAGRLYYLQVVQADRFVMLSDENRINIRLLAPPRGHIVDRFGVAMATNEPTYRVEVVAERDTPQACFTFTDRLERSRAVNYRDYVAVEPAVDGAAIARDRTLCVEGLHHGETYRVTLKDGLLGADGKRLPAADTREVQVPNRKPSLAFRGAGYILPRVGADGLPLRSINLDRAKLQVLRIADRALVEKIYFGRITQQMTDYDIGEILDKSGQEVWRGEIGIGNQPNRTVTTAFPIDAVLGKLEPGVYVAVAGADEIKPGGWDRKATQWFVVSDLGLNTILGEDSLVVFARSVQTAAPAAGVELRLVARNGTELGRVQTGEDGLGRFDLASARLFRAQEQEHVDAIVKALRGLGGKAEAQPEEIDVSRLKSRTDYVELLYEMESATIDAELSAISKLSAPWPRSLLASTVANQAQHLVLLRRELGAKPLETVPVPFENGTAPAP